MKRNLEGMPTSALIQSFVEEVGKPASHVPWIEKTHQLRLWDLRQEIDQRFPTGTPRR